MNSYEEAAKAEQERKRRRKSGEASGDGELVVK